MKGLRHWRLHQFRAAKDKDAARRTVLAMAEAITPLKQFPMMGRPVEDHLDLRELVIDFGASGYIALYVFESALDVVTILALKHQREDDYK